METVYIVARSKSHANTIFGSLASSVAGDDRAKTFAGFRRVCVGDLRIQVMTEGENLDGARLVVHAA